MNIKLNRIFGELSSMDVKQIDRMISMISKMDESYDDDDGEQNEKNAMEEIIDILDMHGYSGKWSILDKYSAPELIINKNGRYLDTLYHIDTSFKSNLVKPGFINAVLITPEGYEVSASRGDYFQYPDDYVFDGYTLITEYVNKDNKTITTKINNPKITELPDIVIDQAEIKYDTDKAILHFENKKGKPVHLIYKLGSHNITNIVNHLKNLESGGG